LLFAPNPFYQSRHLYLPITAIRKAKTNRLKLMRAPLPMKLARALATGQSYSVECRLRGADGNYRWMLVRGSPLSDGAGHTVKWALFS
jgi:PAS domain-containing protein